MAGSANLLGLESLKRKLEQRQRDTAREGDVSVLVGFQTAYAIYVHENMEARHPVGQAKFLEQPARTMKSELRQIVAKLTQQGRPLVTSLVAAGMRLQREAQRLCPVDTGTLRASAFTRPEE